MSVEKEKKFSWSEVPIVVSAHQVGVKIQEVSSYVKSLFTGELLKEQQLRQGQSPYRVESQSQSLQSIQEIPVDIIERLGSTLEFVGEDVLLVENFFEDVGFEPENVQGLLKLLFEVADQRGVKDVYGMPQKPSRFLSGFEINCLIDVYSLWVFEELGFDSQRFFIQLITPEYYASMAAKNRWCENSPQWTISSHPTENNWHVQDILVKSEGKNISRKNVCNFPARLRHSMNCPQHHESGLVRLVIREK